MTETKVPTDLEKNPFYGLFQKHPWLIPLLMMLRRQLGILNEFIEINVKPHSRKQKK